MPRVIVVSYSDFWYPLVIVDLRGILQISHFLGEREQANLILQWHDFSTHNYILCTGIDTIIYVIHAYTAAISQHKTPYLLV